MPQESPASVDTQIAAEQSQPVLLFEIGLDAGTLRYSATKSPLVFPTAGNTYTAKAIEMGNIKTTKEDQIARITVQFDDVLQDMSAYNYAEKFDGKSLVIKKVYRDALGNATYYRELFNGFMEEPKSVPPWMVINAVMGRALGRRMLLDYYQRECNHLFGDSKCNRDGYADLTSLKATGTADAGSTADYLIDSALTQVNDYWNHGRIEITIGGIIHYRRVTDFDAATDKVTFDLPMHTAVSAGDAYTLYKGCSNTWDSCQSNQSWGPSSDNKANFKGCLHIGDKGA